MVKAATFLCFIALTSLFAPPGFASDVTSRIESIGNPSKSKWPDSNSACRYARNVWDLQSFSGKLYIGSGNALNNPPCQNAGPVPIISYNPPNNSFAAESSIDQEQIDMFKILNGVLTIPGHDPRGGTSNGVYWYTLDNGSWTTRTGPTALAHVYDMAVFDGKLFVAGVTTDLTVSQVLVSSNNGQTWSSTNLLDPFLSFSMAVVQNKLYIFRLTQAAIPSTIGLYQYAGGTTLTSMNNYIYNNIFNLLFPTISSSTAPDTRVFRPTSFNNSLVYIGAKGVGNHHSDPFGLFKLTTIGTSSTDAQKIDLPASAKPWDILVNNGKVYILGSIPNGNRYWVTVSSSSDLTNWTEEFRFDSPTFARSFENINSDWYFGLGTDTTTLSVNSGDILLIATVQPSESPAPQIPGDLDGNGQVDIFDYNTLLTNFGKSGSGSLGDIDNSGTIDIFDYNTLLTNFGK